MRPRTVFADLRCLQDDNYAGRGIGSHVTSLLRGRGEDWKIVGLLDPALPSLDASGRALCDQTSYCLNPPWQRDGAVFLDASPMTHDSRFAAALANRRDLLTAAMVYDFIPLDWPGYARRVSERMEYLARLARLRRSAIFFAISHYTARRLRELTGITEEKITVTGAAVRGSLAAQAGREKENAPGYVLLVGGDRRKNADTVVKAMRRLWDLGAVCALSIVGAGWEPLRSELEKIAGPEAGRIKFIPKIDDAELAALYRGATLMVAASHLEGFSLPVAEAAVFGCPVIASSCAAHLELVKHPAALFESANADELADRIRALAAEPRLRDEVLAAQREIATEFTEARVNERFWERLAGETARREERSAARVSSRAKPRIAFFSPYPPDQSGVALFTQATLRAAARQFAVDLYTDARRPLDLPDGLTDAGPVTAAAMVRRRYDSSAFVIGNAPCHNHAFELQETWGGPCILHDSRLTQIYLHRLGMPKFLALSARLTGRQVTEQDVTKWMLDEDLETFFVEPVAEKAWPLIVHTRRLQTLLRERFGIPSEVIPFMPCRYFRQEELARAGRSAARTRLGLMEAAFVVSSFGFLGEAKAPETCIAALGELRGWDVPAELHFVGGAGKDFDELQGIAEDLGIARHIRLYRDYVPEQVCRDYLTSSDAALQLRTYDLGQASGALADCVSAGLPTVASESIADACEAPDYVRRLPGKATPRVVAEALRGIWEGRGAPRELESRRIYLEGHSPRAYARRLAEVLGYD